MSPALALEIEKALAKDAIRNKIRARLDEIELLEQRLLKIQGATTLKELSQYK